MCNMLLVLVLFSLDPVYIILLYIYYSPFYPRAGARERFCMCLCQGKTIVYYTSLRLDLNSHLCSVQYSFLQYFIILQSRGGPFLLSLILFHFAYSYVRRKQQKKTNKVSCFYTVLFLSFSLIFILLIFEWSLHLQKDRNPYHKREYDNLV